jgi:exopolysaccharide production protein ExoQ
MLSPAVALLVGLLFLLLLLRYDSANASRTLWVPLTWMFFAGSRLPSQWLTQAQPSGGTSAIEAFEEGSALDRTVFLILIGLAFWILARRNLDWATVFRDNSALTLLLLFALISVSWSDFPFISFKRWIRNLGTYVMVLVVLSERRPLEAIATLIRRFSYFLLVLSTALIRYTDIGIFYNTWTGSPEYVGAATSKNTLGLVTLISGLFFFWDTVNRWPDRRDRAAKRAILLNIVSIVMTLWLMRLSASATSQSCFVVGCLIIAVARSRWVTAKPRRLTTAVPISVIAYLVLNFVFDVSSFVAPLLGRDPTLTGRTNMWNVLLEAQTNPLIGVGYQTFWHGSRLTTLWSTLGITFLTEAHNGYLDTYLNLGLTGLALLLLFLVAAYRAVSKQFLHSPHFAPFSLALWTITIAYNITESAFDIGLLWPMLLLCVIVVPRAHAEAPSKARVLPSKGPTRVRASTLE